MGDEASNESAEDLIEAANGQASKPQLARWHRLGLIPPPAGRMFLGRGKGSATLYPSGTKAQLLRLCELLRRDRRIAHARWRLWRERYSIPTSRVRTFLDDIAEKFDDGVRSFRRGDQLSHQAWKYLDRVDDARLIPALRRVRKRVGKARFSTVMRILTETATGMFRGWTSISDSGAADVSEREILEKGAGLERARRDCVGIATPWLTGDTGNDLTELSKLFDGISMKEVLADTSDAELVEARDELESLLSVLSGMSILGEGLLGRGAFGLAVVRELTEAPPQGQGFLLLGWLVLRRQQVIAEGCKALISQSQEWLPKVATSQALQGLRSEVPGVRAILSYRRCRRALQDPKAMEQMLAEIKAFADANRDEIRAFFYRHPEYQKLDTPKASGQAN